MNEQFLPICRADMLARGWQEVDFVVVMGDAYVDHPSFGSAIIARLLEKEGWRVGIISQPDCRTCGSMKEYGRPRYGFLSAEAMWTAWWHIILWQRCAVRGTNIHPAA